MKYVGTSMLHINYLDAYQPPEAHKIIKNEHCFIYRCGLKKRETQCGFTFVSFFLNETRRGGHEGKYEKRKTQEVCGFPPRGVIPGPAPGSRDSPCMSSGWMEGVPARLPPTELRRVLAHRLSLGVDKKEFLRALGAG